MDYKKKKNDWRLGEILIQKGWISWEQLEAALQFQAQDGEVADTSKMRKEMRRQEEFPATFLSIGEILIRNAWISWEQLKEALAIQKNKGIILGKILLDEGFVKEPDLYHAIAIQSGRAFVDFDRINIPRAILDKVPKTLAYEHSFLPLIEKDMIFLIVISDPRNIKPELEMAKLFPYHEIRTAVATPQSIQKALSHYYGPL